MEVSSNRIKTNLSPIEKELKMNRERLMSLEHGSTKGQKFYPDTLTHAEVEKLVEIARGSGKAISKIRNSALITVLWRTGIRVGEALNLKPSDYDSKTHTLRVVSTKTRNCRRVGLDIRTVETLEKWLERRESLKIKRGQPIFCLLEKGKEGSGMINQYLNRLLKKLATKAGIEKRLHCHIFRHTFASELLHEGFKLNQIQCALNHNRISTTSVYLRSISSDSETIEAMKERIV